MDLFAVSRVVQAEDDEQRFRCYYLALSRDVPVAPPAEAVVDTMTGFSRELTLECIGQFFTEHEKDVLVAALGEEGVAELDVDQMTLPIHTPGRSLTRAAAEGSGDVIYWLDQSFQPIEGVTLGVCLRSLGSCTMSSLLAAAEGRSRMLRIMTENMRIMRDFLSEQGILIPDPTSPPQPESDEASEDPETTDD